MRPRPQLWLALPRGVTDSATLATHLRGFGTDKEHPSYTPLQTAADLLAACTPSDVSCLQAVLAAIDRAAEKEASGPARRYWESVAHAVDRLVDAERNGG